MTPLYTRGNGVDEFCRGIKFFRGGPIISNIFVPGGPNILIFFDWGEQCKKVRFFHDSELLESRNEAPNHTLCDSLSKSFVGYAFDA